MVFEVDKGLSQSNTIKEKNETKTSVSNKSIVMLLISC